MSKNFLHLILCLLGGIMMYTPLQAQRPALIDSTSSTSDSEIGFVRKTWKDGLSIAASPFHWDRKDRLTALGLVGGAGALMFFDEDIRDFIQDHRTSTIDDITKYGLEPWGSPRIIDSYSVYLTAGFMAHGMIARHQKSMKTAELAFRSMIINTILVQTAKHLLGRERPDRWPPSRSYMWNGPCGGGVSFPSGHSSQIFTVATIIALQYKDIKWVPYVSYSLASLVGVSRLFDDKHWASDIYMGAIVGHLIARAVYNSDKKRNLNISPVMGDNYTGLKLVFSL